MSFRLDNKVIAITGGESGIGRSMAQRCELAGSRVAILALDYDRAQEVVDEIGPRSIAIRADVRKPDEVDAALAQVESEFGRLDTVIANAGVGSPATPFVDLDLERWQAAIETNLTGTFHTLQAGARRLIEGGRGGSLLATGSSTVFRPHTGQHAAYVAAKGGVHALIRALAMELAPHRIRVNAIAPGLTDSPATRALAGYIEKGLEIVPLGELVDADELGALAAFMASDDARHMTGSIVRLDAGRTAD